MTRTSRKLLTVVAAFAALALLPAQMGSAAPSQDGNSLKELQSKRAEVRQKKSAQAGEVNALSADDAEATAALQALSAEVRAQQDKVEEAERALAQANADRVAAEEAQATASAELDSLRAEIKESAVAAYVNIGSGASLSTVGTKDMNEAVNKRTLLEVQAKDSQDLIERYRSVEEDLELQRRAAAAAEERANEKSKEVTARKAELDTSYEKQEAFAAEVEERLNRSLAEADALAKLDSQLSAQITEKQQAIAAAAAAAEAARKRASAASAQAARATSSSGGGSASSSGGGSSASSGGGGSVPNITGSGSIVSVGGIQVHASIAGNLQRLLSAASASGINFSGGGYRDPAGQIAVRRNNCGSSNYAIYEMPASSCRPPTARPGSSMHEQGLAIDFTQGGSTLTRGSSGYQWLKANAASFGFYNLPSEPWHWSTNGN